MMISAEYLDIATGEKMSLLTPAKCFGLHLVVIHTLPSYHCTVKGWQ